MSTKHFKGCFSMASSRYNNGNTQSRTENGINQLKKNNQGHSQTKILTEEISEKYPSSIYDLRFLGIASYGNFK